MGHGLATENGGVGGEHGRHGVGPDGRVVAFGTTVPDPARGQEKGRRGRSQQDRRRVTIERPRFRNLSTAWQSNDMRTTDSKSRFGKRKLTMRDAQDDFGLSDPHSRAETERQSPCGSGKP